MGLFDTFFKDTTPVNREEMVTLCEQNITSGQFDQAARIAQKYKSRVTESKTLTKYQKTLDAAYSWFYLVKAAYFGIRAHQSSRTYEYYKSFFSAHLMGHWCFQDLLLTGVDDWDENSEHFPYFEEMNGYYDKLYQDFGDDAELERADTDANELISNAQRGIH